MRLDGVLRQEAIYNNFSGPHPLAEEEKKEFDQMVEREISTLKENHMTWAKLSPAQKEHESFIRKQKTNAVREKRLAAERASQAAKDYKKTPDYLWDRALNGRQFETLVMKVAR